jgi:hypothetical protein
VVVATSAGVPVGPAADLRVMVRSQGVLLCRVGGAISLAPWVSRILGRKTCRSRR